jgi:spore coat polysaccharide biosynthesis predicted glycosyltransferase SpsG
VSIELVAGRLDGVFGARVRQLGVEERGSPPSRAVVVVDLPDLRTVVDRYPAESLVVFDDRNAFQGRAAIVVQPSLPAWSGDGLADRVLAGFAYAPVGQRYRTLRTRIDAAPPRTRSGPPRVLMCFGGSDPHHVSRRLGSAVTGLGRWEPSLVVGADFGGRVDDLAVPVLRDPADLADRMADCDLALIGAGTMKFEVACLGRPALLVAAADDQMAVGPPFGATGAARWLGDGRTVDPDVVRRAIVDLLDDRAAAAAMSAAARAVVDGRGADRIVDAIAALET